MGKVKDLEGQRFGRLVVIKYVGIDKKCKALWKCECDCGESKIVSGILLLKGEVKSCGCIKKEMRIRDWKKLNNGFLKYSIDGTNISTFNKKIRKTNTSGINGVVFRKSRNKWTATITVQGKRIYLGQFDELKYAISARKKAEEIYFQPIIDKFNALNK